MSASHIHPLAKRWSRFLVARAWIVLAIAVIVSVFAVLAVDGIKISTKVNALMPENAASVKTLKRALEKAGSYSSIQIVAESDTPGKALEFIQATKAKIDGYEWVASSQYSENVEVISQHQPLLRSMDELKELENDIDEAHPNYVAKEISKATGQNVSVHFRETGNWGYSHNEVNSERIEMLVDATNEPKKESANFVSKDGKTALLIVWPKPGYSSLSKGRRMVNDSYDVMNEVQQAFPDAKGGVAGRIASQVAQFGAVMTDLGTGLASAGLLISILIMLFYRSFCAVPIIIIPLALSILWTMAITAVTIGGLNLITAFLILILFGLGIDFAIHNFSRYAEERHNGSDVTEALSVMVGETGHASLMAATTTSMGFFALILTEFRAFNEFGFIAGMGIILALVSMYTVFPALLVLFERAGWKPSFKQSAQKKILKYLNPLKVKPQVVALAGAAILLAAIFAPHMQFETNTKNLQSKLKPAHAAAVAATKNVFKQGSSRAIFVAEDMDELQAINAYFKDKIETDTETPSIKKTQSLLDYVPPPDVQQERLNIIRRLKNRADQFQGLDPERYESSEGYLSIGQLNVSDLPASLRRSLLGQADKPGFLFYVEDDVRMSDVTEATLFYDDVAQVEINGKTKFAASESFILLEMLDLMKADALKAIILVALTTAVVIFFFLKSFRGMLIVLTPTFMGIFFTVGVMGAFGPALSIMNMVILPSLVGISVDNGLHIYHRYLAEEGKTPIYEIMQTTGTAAVLTTLTTLIGFGGMITASMGGLRSMAILAIIGFMSCLLMTWLILPILIERYGRMPRLLESAKI